MPGPPLIATTPFCGARIARSCSAWIVATIECIERSRARESWPLIVPSGQLSGGGTLPGAGTPSVLQAHVPVANTLIYVHDAKLASTTTSGE